MKSFIVFQEYYDLITLLNEEEQKNVIFAIIKYMFEDVEIELNDNEKKIFNYLKISLNISKKRSKSGSKSKQDQKEIKLKSKQNQKEIKLKSNKDHRSEFDEVLYSLYNININNINNKEYINKIFKEYIEIRNKKKYIVNETVINRLIKKLNEYGKTDEEKIKIIENAINGAWRDFYELSKKEKEEIDDGYYTN